VSRENKRKDNRSGKMRNKMRAFLKHIRINAAVTEDAGFFKHGIDYAQECGI
jgi:hypothetical protein